VNSSLLFQRAERRDFTPLNCEAVGRDSIDRRHKKQRRMPAAIQ